MGTRRLQVYAYRHRGTYYVNYNHWDRYLDGLGRDLVGQIPTDEEAFKEWLERMRAYYDEEQLRIEKLLDEGEKTNPNAYTGYCSIPSKEPPSLDLGIEWVYVFDLDRIAFSVDNCAHFKLNNLPRGEELPDWVDFLHEDGTGHRCLLPTTPREYIADISPQAPQPSEDGLAVYNECRPKLATSSDLVSQPMDACEDLAFGLAKDFIINFYSFFSNISGFRPSDPEFGNIAAGLLYAASPGLPFIPTNTNGFKIREMASDESLFEIPHRQFWYRGRLIRLSSHLYIEENLKAEVGTVVKAIQTKGMAECVAILLSVRHVVFVTISGNDIARTAAIPIMDAFGHGPLEVILSRLSVGLRLLVHYLRPSIYDAKSILARPSLGLQHDEPAKSGLPLDVVVHILRFVDDETYARCSKLSRTYRDHCISQPRIGQYTLLRRKEENCYVARVSDSPNVSIRTACYCPQSTFYPVYIRDAEGRYLVPLTLRQGYKIGITVCPEGEVEFKTRIHS